MDQTDQTQQHQNPATDDQELAKVLAGMNDNTPALPPVQDDAKGPAESGLQFEATPMPAGDDAQPAAEPAAVADETPAETPAEPAAEPEPVVEPLPEPPALDETPTPGATGSGDLEGIKKDALEELRPLVSKLDLPADEKFDTMLLIIRSTDDKSLVGAAHEAAKAIDDEQKRAAALLDIIKEIDYFSGQGTQPAA